eukprot:NODE_20339_length_802_cov_8.253333.p4 GENE.NODE_20339_length_802_cov_8.253333~~NODE_20339_length_802_cov_8.253333.p4  ORF type:complete len:89 (+),score=12.66 NODE_20339_length_802_cov_8.253333:530-796(+)
MLKYRASGSKAAWKEQVGLAALEVQVKAKRKKAVDAAATRKKRASTRAGEGNKKPKGKTLTSKATRTTKATKVRKAAKSVRATKAARA